MNIFKTSRALFVAAGLAVGTAASWGATVPAWSDGDLFLGFRSTAGGNDNVLLVKLGADTQFTTAAAGSSFNLSLGSLALDLVNLFGPDWATQEDLAWGVFGAKGSGIASTLYASRARENPLEKTAAWASLNGTQRADTLSGINSVRLSYTGKQATANSPVATVQSATLDGGYAYQLTNYLTDFSTTSGWTSIEGNFGDGAASSILDLYRIAPNGVTNPGSFSISNAGVVSFTAAAVPEPSALALLALAAVPVALVASRRFSHRNS